MVFPSLIKHEIFSQTSPPCSLDSKLLSNLQLHQEIINIWALLPPSTEQRAIHARCPPRQEAPQLPASHFCLAFRWGCSLPALSVYTKLHALNISQKFKVTEPEVLQSGTFNFCKLVRILECACSLFNCSTSFSYMLLGTAVQDTY